LIAFYGIRLGNEVGLFSKDFNFENRREVNKKGKYKQEKKEASYKKQVVS